MAHPEGDIVDLIASYLGAPGPALRILLSLLLAYPMAFFHRSFLYNKSANLQHIFFILGGSYIGYFNYGFEIGHAYICIIVQYLVLLFSHGTQFSVAFSFLFQMGYLLTEYYLTETATYDIKWTIPHCVLTLRLIGQAFDLYDGQQNDNDLSKDQKQSVLRKFPTLLESAGHVLQPGSFMIGPQYSMKRYLDFVNGAYLENGKAPSSVSSGLKRLCLGLAYVAIYQVGSIYINNDYILGDSYKQLPFLRKMFLMGIYGRVMLYKYVSCWIITEGACTIFGLSYNGKDLKGNSRWDALENINIPLFEKSYMFSHVILSFNKCTNHWVAQYIYKRLKFLGNRFISQALALGFLAVWHGLHSGYYMCFFMEFIVVNMEKDVEKIFQKNPTCMRWHHSPIGSKVDYIFFKIVQTSFFGYCLIPFTLLKYKYWIPAYMDVYFCGTIIFGLWPLYKPLIKALFKSSQSSENFNSATKGKDSINENSKAQISKPKISNGVKTE